MSNIFDYVNKYGDIRFEDKEFNDLDNLIFSLLSYLDFDDTSINNNISTLNMIALEYYKITPYDKVRKCGPATKEAYKLLKIVMNKGRYKNILLLNYVNNTSNDIQFSALTFKLTNNLIYISFEGTNELISGWKEDFELACFFPVPAQTEAIKYLNNSVTLFGPNVIVGGHSKGGNLALVASMYIKKYKYFKIKKVYNNDGPGLRKKEFLSCEYKALKNKYIHIIPSSSMVGILLRNDNYKVVKCNKNNLYSHSIFTWMVNDDSLILDNLSVRSKKLEQSVISWLDKHDDNERINLVNNLFKPFEEFNINSIPDATKISNVIKIIRSIKTIDHSTKMLFIDLITYNYKYLITKDKDESGGSKNDRKRSNGKG